MCCRRQAHLLLSALALLAVLSVAAGVSVRVTSETTPEGTTATVNGEPVQPGEWDDNRGGHGTFTRTAHSSHISYSASSSSGGGGGGSGGSASASSASWSSGEEDDGPHCAYDAVTVTREDGKDPVVTETHSKSCGDKAVGGGEAEPKKGKRSKFDKVMRRKRAAAMAAMQNLQNQKDPSEPQKFDTVQRGTSSKRDDQPKGEAKGEGEREGVYRDFGDGMRASAKGTGDRVTEEVSGSTRRGPDGSTSRRVSASATASSSTPTQD